MARLTYFLILLLVVCAWCQTGFAGTIRNDVNDSLYVDLAQQSEYDSVGSVSWTEGLFSYSGSGTYIGDSWVLTAAHVADGTDYAGNGNSNWRFSVGGSNYFAQEFVIPTGWTEEEGDLASGWDIALVRLSEEVTGIAAATIYDATDEEDYVGTIVGYGSTGTGDTGFLDNSSGTKRAGENAIDAIGGDRRVRNYSENVLFADFDDPSDSSESIMGSNTALDLEYMSAPGDSGGGLFIEVDGVHYIAGVTSFGLAFDGDTDADYGDLGGYTRTSQFVDWIEEVTGIVPGLIINELVGDFNLDGFVDAADYTVWRDSLGETVVAGTGADANGDGIIDEDDLLLWQANYDSSANNGSLSTVFAVPEPSALILAAFFLACPLTRTRHISS